MVPCFTHHVSDFIRAALNAGLKLEALREYFDEPTKEKIPRILTMLLRRVVGRLISPQAFLKSAKGN